MLPRACTTATTYQLRIRQFVAVLLFACFYTLNAYVCDDAFMIFRSVDNALNGVGLTWNSNERVQVFTGPLYTLLLLIAYLPSWFFRAQYDPTSLYLTALFLGFVVSAVGIWYQARFCRSCTECVVGLLLLFSSQAFVPFTSSGLETPLTLTLVTLFYWRWFDDGDEKWSEQRSRWLFIVASLCALNRLDSALLFVPALAWHSLAIARHAGVRVLLRQMIVAALPLVAWEIFSVIYYGSPFPNSYYAKVGSGVEHGALWSMGRGYLVQSWQTDPITLLVIAAVGLGLAGLMVYPNRRARIREIGLAWLGALCAVVYITRIGGDFIGFRFLAAPFVVSVMCLVVCLRSLTMIPRIVTASLLSVASAMYLVLWTSSPLRTPWDLPSTFDIKYYYPASSPLLYRLGNRFPFAPFHSVTSADHCAALRLSAPQVLIMAGGLRGFCSGPLAHTIDPLSITDPLMARLPAPPGLGLHVPGHIVKPLPKGYWESAVTGENRFVDPALKEFYDVLHQAISGPLFTRARWKAIWRLNFEYGGRYTQPYEPSPEPQPTDPR